MQRSYFLESDLLCLDQRNAVDGLELAQELLLKRVVIGFRPGPVLLERLHDTHLEVEAAAADLPRDLGFRERLQLRKVLAKQLLARLERGGVARAARLARAVAE